MRSDTQGPNQQYAGYLTENAIPPNGSPYTFGITYPSSPVIGQFHLRTDFFPNRLFKWDGKYWIKVQDSVRMTEDNFGYQDTAPGKLNAGKDVELNQKASFVNNNNTATINGVVIQEKQSLSKALRPKADNL